MAEPLVNIERLRARVGEAIESPEEIALAEEMLEAASDWVRFYGTETWDTTTVPAVAATITVAAAARGYLNPALDKDERSDAINYERSELAQKGCQLTSEEIQTLRYLGGRKGATVQSLPMGNADRFRTRSDGRRAYMAKYVPIDGGYQAPFPFFAEDDWSTQ